MLLSVSPLNLFFSQEVQEPLVEVLVAEQAVVVEVGYSLTVFVASYESLSQCPIGLGLCQPPIV